MTWWMLIGLWVVGFVLVHLLSPKGWSRATTQVYAAVTFVAWLLWYVSPGYRPVAALLCVVVVGLGLLQNLGRKGSFVVNLLQAWWVLGCAFVYFAFITTDTSMKLSLSDARAWDVEHWTVAIGGLLLLSLFMAGVMTGMGAAARRTKAAVTAKGGR